MKELFHKLAEHTSSIVGSPWAFLLAVTTVGVWIATGEVFSYSDTWQLVINTGTTIVTFLVVFLIQNTQNRQSRVVALKLDELLRASKGARIGMVELDHMTDAELEAVQREFSQMQAKYHPLLDDDIAHVEHELKQRKHGK